MADPRLVTEGGAQALPSMPAAALLLGQVFRSLGGWLCIDSEGGRRFGTPLYFDEGFPQLPDAQPFEQFRTGDEHRGAMKVLEGIMRRLCQEDRELLFDALADVAVDPRTITPSIEEPRRAQ